MAKNPLATPQSIAQMVIERNPHPDKRFRSLQLRSANALIKLYSAAAVVRVLCRSEGRRVTTLAPQWVQRLVEGEQTKLDDEGHQPAVPEPPRPAFVARPSILTKLKALD
jgi:hypothetical protein